MFGFFNVFKPAGPTSHDVVAHVRRRLGRGVKVGHAGTLDPFADGVLVICVGPATRLADYVQAQPKRYVAEIALGATSTTDDPEGQIAPTTGAEAPAEEAVRAAIAGFVGTIRQVPPAHSAVHVGGRRAYELARAGAETPLPPREVTVHAIKVREYQYPRLEIDVRCGSGTYVRALARDIGRALGVGGYCARLTRTEVGVFHIDQAVSPDALAPERHLLPPLLGLEAIPRVTVDKSAAWQIAHGKAVVLPQPVEAVEAAVLDEAGRLLALAEVHGGVRLQPKKVFSGA